MNSVPGTSGRRRWLSAAAVTALAAAGSLAGMPAASAAGDYLEFSTDGRNYSSTLSTPIFADSFTYVPGSTARGQVWVRNNSADPASLTSAALMVRSDAELNGYLGLRALSGSNLSSRLPLGETGSCTDMNQAWELRPGQGLQLSFVIDFALDAPNDTRNRDAEFDLVFLLEPQAAEQSARPACAAVGPSMPGDPGDTGGTGGAGGGGTEARDRSDVAVLPGTGRSMDAVPAFAVAESGGAVAAAGAGAGGADGGAWPKSISRPDAALAAGFAGTVEPVVRTLSGTLLIAMAAALAAAVVMRLRESRYE